MLFLAVFLAVLLPCLAQAQKGSEHVRIYGVVTNLQTAFGASTLGLQIEPKQVVNVSAAAGISITNLTDGSAVTLANGQKAEVTGTYDRKAALLTATKIVVDNRPDTADGTIASLDATTGTLVLTVKHANFTPTGTTITVATTSKTVIYQGRHTRTFADLAVGDRIEVVGAFDVKGQTLTATSLEIAR